MKYCTLEYKIFGCSFYKASILNYQFYKYCTNKVKCTYDKQTQKFMVKMLNDINDHYCHF